MPEPEPPTPAERASAWSADIQNPHPRYLEPGAGETIMLGESDE